jgi:hypothetical protein
MWTIYRPAILVGPGGRPHSLEVRGMADVAEPNLYELACADLLVTYSTSSIDGSPRFSYQDADTNLSASGEEITARPTDLGTEVTVMLETVPDDHTTTLTLLVPGVNLGDETESSVDTVLVETTNRTSIGGPRLVEGQLQTYRTTALHGTARLVSF